MVCWLHSNCYLWKNFIQNFIFIYTGKCLAGYNVNYQLPFDYLCLFSNGCKQQFYFVLTFTLKCFLYCFLFCDISSKFLLSVFQEFRAHPDMTRFFNTNHHDFMLCLYITLALWRYQADFFLFTFSHPSWVFDTTLKQENKNGRIKSTKAGAYQHILYTSDRASEGKITCLKSKATKPVLPRQCWNEYSAAPFWLQHIWATNPILIIKNCLLKTLHVHPLKHKPDEN